MRTGALRRVLPYLRRHRRRLGTIASLAVVGLTAGAAIPLVVKAVIDGPLADGDRSGMWPLAALALVLGAVEGTVAWWRRRLLAKVAAGVETDLRNDLYAHLQRMDVAFHDRWQSGQLLSRATSDAASIRRFLGFGLVLAFISVVTFAVVIVLMARLHLPLALVVLASGVPLVVLLGRFERQYRVVARRVQDQQGDLATAVEEAATGMRTTRAFGRRALMAERFDVGARLLQASALQRVRLLGRFEWALAVIPNATLAVILLVGGLAVERGSLTLGGLVAFISYLLVLVFPIEALAWTVALAEEASAAAERIFEVFDAEPAIADRPGARPLGPVAGHLRFEAVRFTYGEGRDEVLRGVDLDVAPGETVALVGMTGSGKTTLATLVPRLQDVTGGRVTLDGVDVRDLQLSSLRRAVGFAFEEPTLFSASVLDNLLLGAPGATPADVEAALDVAAAGFVHDLPWGLETRIGEQGMSLSGGQRQRVALARAVLARPPVLVLDDPLSALDVATEARVEAALRRVLAGTTALLVVHRPSTVALADRCALLDDGRIVAVGRHRDLLATEPRYRAILGEAADEPAVASWPRGPAAGDRISRPEAEGVTR